MFYNYKLQI